VHHKYYKKLCIFINIQNILLLLLKMQTITYQVPLPTIGQRVNISTSPTQYVVFSIENQRLPYDSILIKPIDSDGLSRLVITNGRWQVDKYTDDHTVAFLPTISAPIFSVPTVSIPASIGLRPNAPNPTLVSNQLYYDLPTNTGNILTVPEPIVNPYGNQGLDYSIPVPNPNDVRVGDVGTFTVGGRVGRAHWYGFTVTKVVKPGKTIEVEFDTPVLVGKEQLITTPGINGIGWTHSKPPQSKYRTLQYRNPGRWMFKGVPAKDMNGTITMGQKITGSEQGIF
jgi:hypothetical protein